MDDPRATQGVEHLQSAARELLKAARSFLDVVEEVVEDPERLTGAASGLADLVTSSFGRRPQPWESAAWVDDDPSDPEGRPEDDTDAGSGDVDRAAADLDDHDELWGPDEDDAPAAHAEDAVETVGDAEEAIDDAEEDPAAGDEAAEDRGPAPVVPPRRGDTSARRRASGARSTTARTATSRVRRITVE